MGINVTGSPVTGLDGEKVKAETGFVLTVTDVLPAAEAHPLTEAVTK